jgi:hypothetical protein
VICFCHARPPLSVTSGQRFKCSETVCFSAVFATPSALPRPD